MLRYKSHSAPILSPSSPEEMKSLSSEKNDGGFANRLWFIILLAAFAFWSIVYRFSVPSVPIWALVASAPQPPPPPADRCSGRYIYIHDLPSRFNEGLLRDCRNLSIWMDMCAAVSNAGLGPAIDSTTGWYQTEQYGLEPIFHNLMKRYDCLTQDSSLATAIFVPAYLGLDIGRYLWFGHSVAARDSMSLDLVRWLASRREWAVAQGKDHFLTVGRVSWDFRRESDDAWGSNFFNLPEAMNMTILTMETGLWQHGGEIAIPYPTYFHPSGGPGVAALQERTRAAERPWLFSFLGAARPNQTDSIRGQLIKQCSESKWCLLTDCSSNLSKCLKGESVMEVLQKASFCLQPTGDSLTRRSTIDTMLAGCVPVFFHPGTAYKQYLWHLPRDYRRYSVFISEEEVREESVRIEDVLARFSEEEVRAMREEVVNLTPTLLYGDPRSKTEGFRDAFDVAIKGVIDRITGLGLRSHSFDSFQS